VALLTVRSLHLSFGGLRVLDGVDLDVDEGSIVGLVGPNGAGKTSLFNCVCGLYRPDSGSVRLGDDDLLGRPPHALASLGVGRTFQHPSLLPDASVLENVLVGGHCRLSIGAVAAALRLPRARRAEAALRDRATERLADLGIADLAAERAGALPYGTQKRVELARSLLSEPRLLLLDEPAAGLPHGEVDELAELVLALRAEHGLTVLLVEHHMGLVRSVTDRVFVLVEGHNIVDGPAADVQRDPAVVAAYLGGAAA
jgi:branched-chain amino acid transport system ATP-binding protein